MAAPWLRKALDATLDAVRPAAPPEPVLLEGTRMFRALGVQVARGKVYAMDARPLGPLAGAKVSMVDEGGHQIYGALTLNPLPIRQRGTVRPPHLCIAVVAFPTGAMHQKRCYGRQVVVAQAEAVAFTAMAGS